MKKQFKRLTFAVVCILFATANAYSAKQAKYVFYFIGDGMGHNQVNGTEMYLGELEGRIGLSPLCFAEFPVASFATSFSATNSVTDSAAAGTALATGEKTYNSAIGVNEEGSPITSVAVWAQNSGKKVGVTTSVSIDHATPASFYAHQANRRMYYEIATDLPQTGFDFYAGAGFLQPDPAEGAKGKTIYELFDKSGYTVARGYKEYKEKQATANKMILMQEDGYGSGALPYAIDRKENDLTLAQITESAIDFLTKDGDTGFFLMVEGGKIDWASHANDAATVFHEVIDMDQAVRVAYEFYKRHPEETLIVVTADHETGGLGLGRGSSDLNLKALAHQKISQGGLTSKLQELRKAQRNKVSWNDVKALLKENMGFWGDVSLSDEQEQRLKEVYSQSFSDKEIDMEKSEYSSDEPLAAIAKQILNDIALVGWISNGHSDAYVPIFAIGAGAELFNGRIDNTDIPKRIAQAAGYELPENHK